MSESQSPTPSQTTELTQEEVCSKYVASSFALHQLVGYVQVRRRRLQRLGGLSLQGSSPPSLTPSPSPGPASLPHIKTTSPEGRKAVSSILPLRECIIRAIFQRDDLMEVDPSASLPLRLKSSSAGTTPTSSGRVIRPKAKRSHTGDLAPSQTLPSPSTPPHLHSSHLTHLLAHVFRVIIAVRLP